MMKKLEIIFIKNKQNKIKKKKKKKKRKKTETIMLENMSYYDYCFRHSNISLCGSFRMYHKTYVIKMMIRIKIILVIYIYIYI